MWGLPTSPLQEEFCHHWQNPISSCTPGNHALWTSYIENMHMHLFLNAIWIKYMSTLIQYSILSVAGLTQPDCFKRKIVVWICQGLREIKVRQKSCCYLRSVLSQKELLWSVMLIHRGGTISCRVNGSWCLLLKLTMNILQQPFHVMLTTAWLLVQAHISEEILVG